MANTDRGVLEEWLTQPGWFEARKALQQRAEALAKRTATHKYASLEELGADQQQLKFFRRLIDAPLEVLMTRE